MGDDFFQLIFMLLGVRQATRQLTAARIALTNLRRAFVHEKYFVLWTDCSAHQGTVQRAKSIAQGANDPCKPDENLETGICCVSG